MDDLRDVFARAKHPHLHRPGLDEVGKHDQAVAEADAGIGDVEGKRLLGDAEIVVNEAGRRRLEEIARHRAVDEGTDIPGGEAGLLQHSRAAIVAMELGVTFVGHMQRVVTPLTRSSVPNGIRSRW